MRYTVLWKKNAEDELAEIWIDAADRESVTRAAYEIDRRLRVAPTTAGESRDPGQRVLLIAPLGVTFQIYEEDRIVRVADVWRFRVRS